MAVPEKKRYTAEDYLKGGEPFPRRCELIDGYIIDMPPAPRQIHQRLSMILSSVIFNYIFAHKGKCQLFAAPSDVKLDDLHVFQPDLFVTCDPDKLDGQFCNGAPDFVVEILSRSTAMKDYTVKLECYRDAGVREYWIVDPDTEEIAVYRFEKGGRCEHHTFGDSISVGIFENGSETLSIRLADYL